MVVVAAVLLWGVPGFAAWPPPAQATAAQLADPANWPNDPEYAQSPWLFGFTPTTETALSDREKSNGVGMAVDRAFGTTTGQARVVVAVISSGARWEHADLLGRWALSRGEVPVPQNADGTVSTSADPHDRNGDGRFDVRDFTRAVAGQVPTVDLAEDPRLVMRQDGGDANGNGVIDPQDLIRVFSDGTDGDGNGFVDDLCGWDFVEGDNDPLDVLVSGEGTRAAALVAAEANNGIGGVGACPGCAVLPVRATAGESMGWTRAQEAVAFAAKSAPIVAVLSPPRVQGSFDGLLVGEAILVEPAIDDPLVDAAGPSPRRLRVAGLGPDGAPATTLLTARPDCRGSGGSADLAVRVPDPVASGDPSRCGADATALAAGIVALVASAAPQGSTVESLTATLRADTLAVDPERRWNPATGFGRINAAAAVEDAAAGALAPTVRFVTPDEADRVSFTQALPVEAATSASMVSVFAARGRSPLDASFRKVGEATGRQLATPVQLDALEPPLIRGDEVEESMVTLQARAPWTSSRGPTEALSVRRVIRRESALVSTTFPKRLSAPPVGSPRFVDLDADEDDELVAVGRDGRIHAFSPAGAPLERSPLELGRGTISAPPAFGQLDGAAGLQIVVVTDEGTLFAVRADLTVRFERGLTPGPFAAPVIASGPFGPIIVVASQSGLLHLFDAEGTALPGSPLQLPEGRYAEGLAAGEVTKDAFVDLLLASVRPDGRGAAWLVTLSNDGPTVAPGWPVDLGETDAVSVPLISDFDSDGDHELVFGARGHAPVVLRSTGEAALKLEDAARATTSPRVHLAAGDLDGDSKGELIISVEGGLGAFSVGHQLVRNRSVARETAKLRGGFPVKAVLVASTGVAIADVTGEGARDFLFGEKELLSAVSRDGVALLDWPQITGTRVRGVPAVGVQRDRIVVAAITEDGWLYSWDALGHHNDILWDGFGHDPGNTGSTTTPLPPRNIHAIGGAAPGPTDPPGCCAGSIGGFELSFFAALLVLVSANRRRRWTP